MKKIDLSTIVIPDVFLKSRPSEEKLNKVREYFREHGELDKPLIVKSHKNKTLIDNYIRYLVAKELGMEFVPYVTVKESCTTTKEHRQYYNKTMKYVVGVFPDRLKEYTWKNPRNIPVEIGDKVVVKIKDKKKNKNICTVVTVVNVYESDDHNLLKHKPVVKVVMEKEE